MPQPIFDPHVHIINLAKGHYHWLLQADEHWLKNVNQIKKSFSFDDLELLPPFRLEKMIHIEAGFDNTNPERELAFISNISSNIPLISYLALETEPQKFEKKLSLLMLFQQFIGIRDISEGEDYQRLQETAVNSNLEQLAKNQLIFEAQFNLDNPNAVKLFYALSKKFPSLRIVINHCGFVSPENSKNWTQGVKRLSQCQNVYIKFCGFEMLNKFVDDRFKQQTLDILLDSFSENKVMFASNFPLCLTQKSYQQVWLEYYDMQLTPEIWSKLSYENAKKLYLI